MLDEFDADLLLLPEFEVAVNGGGDDEFGSGCGRSKRPLDRIRERDGMVDMGRVC